ncbi:MAG TPA: hypothetical protein VFP87_15630 [Chitinophagaceae bacterium]|nr:hypothetical protein [Chitinophagaceae bacterium]
MKWILIVVCCGIVQSQRCNQRQTVKVPPCIREKIDAIQQSPKYNPPATVYRYLYGNSYVYLFTSECCDQYNYLYDRNCNILCAPSGGITGKGDGRCQNFFTMATDKTLVWQDTR